MQNGGETQSTTEGSLTRSRTKAETAAAYPFSMQSHSKTLKVRLKIGIFKKRSKFGKSGNGGNRYEKRSFYRQSGAGCQPCIMIYLVIKEFLVPQFFNIKAYKLKRKGSVIMQPFSWHDDNEHL